MVFPKTKDDGMYPQGSSREAPSKGFSGKPAENAVRLQAFLGQGVKVVGALVFSGPIEIDGELEGKLTSSDRVFVGPNAVIRGNVEAVEIVVRGTVFGNLSAKGRVVLLAGARVEGDVACAQLVVEPGVVFRGASSMEYLAPGEAYNLDASAEGQSARRLELAKSAEAKLS